MNQSTHHQRSASEMREQMSNVNVGQTERLISQVAGAIIIGATLRAIVSRGLFTLLALLSGGFYLLYRGITGHCEVYEQLLVNTAVRTNDEAVSVPHEQGVHIEESVLINRPVEDIYAFWRNFENLPRFMSHLKSVENRGDNRSHWVAKAPAGMTVEWDAEIINEVRNEVIGWRSLADAQIANAGSVRFRPQTQGTRVTVTMEYVPPAGALGQQIAKWLGEEPKQQIAEDLKKLKQILESEQMPTSNGSAAERSTRRS